MSKNVVLSCLVRIGLRNVPNYLTFLVICRFSAAEVQNIESLFDLHPNSGASFHTENTVTHFRGVGSISVRSEIIITFMKGPPAILTVLSAKFGIRIIVSQPDICVTGSF